jgi:putative ABC transport system permease protein
MSLKIALMILLLLAGERVEQRLTRDAAGIDLVIGAKGSPLQLILSSLYHVDIPTGNIPYEMIERWRGHDLVEAVIPIALGDSAAGFRLVGTEPAFPEHYGASLADGRYWQAPFEATLGRAVAERTGLGIGDQFAGSHGLAPGGPAHADHPYTVVGIFEPTGSIVDRLILTGIESVWQTHGLLPDDEDRTDIEKTAGLEAPKPAITALLLRYKSAIAAVRLPPLVNAETGLQAASPAWEIARLLSLIGVGMDTLRGVGLLLMGISALTLFIALVTSLQARQHDLAVMRTLGASPGTLLRQLLLEGLLLAAIGAVLGLLLGHGAASALAWFAPETEALGMSGLTFLSSELYVIALALIVGIAAALIPAIQAYRSDIAGLLTAGR